MLLRRRLERMRLAACEAARNSVLEFPQVRTGELFISRYAALNASRLRGRVARGHTIHTSYDRLVDFLFMVALRRTLPFASSRLHSHAG